MESKKGNGKINLRMKIRSVITEASLTIEAALGVTAFIFMVICLIMPMKMLNTQRRVQTVLEAVSRDMSQYAYIPYRISMGETDVENSIRNVETDSSQGIKALFEKAALSVYLRGKIHEAAGAGAVEALDFSRLRLENNGEVIDLHVTYRLRLPFSVFRIDSVPAASRSLRRGFIGAEGGREELNREGQQGTEEMVYVGNNMGRYHRSRDCHYISNKITAVSLENIEEQLSSSGSRYRACSVCEKKGSFGGQVYIMPNGAYYHARKDCSSITYYVRQVPLSEVIHLGACSYCGK